LLNFECAHHPLAPHKIITPPGWLLTQPSICSTKRIEIQKKQNKFNSMTKAPQLKSASTKSVSLIVNGAAITVDAETLAALLVEAGFAGRVATAVNGNFVAERARAETKLQPGDRIEILTPRQGG
jgi:sulfur carrier protein